ncbi:MAG: sigma-70 family RNA polymerase sigma factor, partial [Lachnospiraceae bacterium]|nr:sigma-70 family RNA polymerase sigma factor [Lachnospiraceae bacterium]
FQMLFSAGVAGLISAVDRFDPNGFSAFHSYASMWIQQSIQRYCNPTWMEFYYPMHAKEVIIKIYRQYALSGDEGVFNDLIRKHPEMTSLISAVKLQVTGKLSLEELEEQEDWEDYEKYFTYTGLSPETYSELKDRDRILDMILDELQEREKAVVCMRNGVGYPEELTLEAIGQSMGLTRERIRQIEAKAYKHLTQIRKTKKLKDYC